VNRSLPYFALTLVVASSLASCSSIGVRRAKVVPQRPRFGRTTQTTAFGTFEVEAGFAANPKNSAEVGTMIKTGLSPTAEFFVDLAPYRYYDPAGPDIDGIGDVTLGLRQRLMNESKNYPATAVELAVQVPTGDEELYQTGGVAGVLDQNGLVNDNGYANVFGAFMIDRTFDTLYTTLYYQFGAIGTNEQGDQLVQHRGSLAGTIPVWEKWKALGELGVTYIPETGLNPLILNLAALYALSDTLQFDAGAIIGLNEDAADVIFRAGLTTNLGIFF
jgi:hypothetical protein